MKSKQDSNSVNLRSGLGHIFDIDQKQTTAYVVDKRYKVHDASWSVIWGFDSIMKKSEEVMNLGDKLIFDDNYKMGTDDLRILLTVIKKAEIGNVFSYKQQILVDLLKISKARVSKSIKKLIQYEVLYPLKEFGRSGFYINASVAYKGELEIGTKLKKLPLREQVEISLSQIKNGIYTIKRK